jgi:hypothetical protein
MNISARLVEAIKGNKKISINVEDVESFSFEEIVQLYCCQLVENIYIKHLVNGEEHDIWDIPIRDWTDKTALHLMLMTHNEIPYAFKEEAADYIGKLFRDYDIRYTDECIFCMKYTNIVDYGGGAKTILNEVLSYVN